MKKLTRIALSIVLALGAVAPAAAKPFQIGPVVGVNLNSVNLNDVGANFKSDNRCGFAGGLMAKFTVPIINIGVDLSALYEHRTSQMENPQGGIDNLKYDYLAVPLHLRYDIPMPVISQVFFPTIFTGPNFGFRLGKSIVNDFKANKYNIGWDFGLGITLVKHLQISAAYTLGMNKALSYTKVLQTEDAGINGKTSGWTITVAYLF
ncbi:MAG: PorT family protein [Muribaculaceae bacterium]|nr:PorT family protein [Muribaculaceae bacterium]